MQRTEWRTLSHRVNAVDVYLHTQKLKTFNVLSSVLHTKFHKQANRCAKIVEGLRKYLTIWQWPLGELNRWNERNEIMVWMLQPWMRVCICASLLVMINQENKSDVSIPTIICVPADVNVNTDHMETYGLLSCNWHNFKIRAEAERSAACRARPAPQFNWHIKQSRWLTDSDLSFLPVNTTKTLSIHRQLPLSAEHGDTSRPLWNQTNYCKEKKITLGTRVDEKRNHGVLFYH